jgi:hypothetical protein
MMLLIPDVDPPTLNKPASPSSAVFAKETTTNTTGPEATRGGITLPHIICPVVLAKQTSNPPALTGVIGGEIVPDIERISNLPTKVSVLPMGWRRVTLVTSPFSLRMEMPLPR